MPYVVSQDELPGNPHVAIFQGHQHGDVNVSFFVVNFPPGGGPQLHEHPYEEVFLVQEGEAVYTVADATMHARGGQIVIVPPGTPHKFINSGDGPLRLVAIHPNREMTTSFLE
jgi:quercetin dioxygenase-like cupin family protein